MVHVEWFLVIKTLPVSYVQCSYTDSSTNTENDNINNSCWRIQIDRHEREEQNVGSL